MHDAAPKAGLETGAARFKAGVLEIFAIGIGYILLDARPMSQIYYFNE